MKKRVAIVTIIAPLVFCYMKSQAGLNTLTMHQLSWSVAYACFSVLLWDRRRKLMMFASFYNLLLSILCLYKFLPPYIVKALPILANQVYCIVFMGLIAYGLSRLISTKIA